MRILRISMEKLNMRKFILIIVSLFLLAQSYSQVRLPQLVRDSMILQRDVKVNLWGWASKNEKVSIKFNGKNYKTTTAADGKWILQLQPTKAGGPYTMEITGTNKIVLKEILV